MNDSSQSGKSEDGGDAEEGSSSSSSSTSSSETNLKDPLTSFREEWQRELATTQKQKSFKGSPLKPVNANGDYTDESIGTRAKNLFLIGIEFEKNRQFYDAIQYYKHAVQLVPDIEFQIYESSKVEAGDENTAPPENDVKKVESKAEVKEDEEGEGENLLVKLCKTVSQDKCICFPNVEQSGTHISALPIEILLYILKWVVSSELDMRSLEMFSRVCCSFYVLARDSEIWRLACVRAWGVNCGNYSPKYQSWREMYLKRHRLRYNGCYISRISYIRHGENSFQDIFYRPWHLVEYYRYIRFFPEGKVLMLTSSDEAQTCVNSLRSRTPRNPSVLIGHYRLHDNYVTVVLKKQEVKTISTYRKKKKESIYERTFHIEFKIRNHFKRTNSMLEWSNYSISTRYTNEHDVCLIDSSAKKSQVSTLEGRFPPLKFSRVKSYTQESVAPLQ